MWAFIWALLFPEPALVARVESLRTVSHAEARLVVSAATVHATDTVPVELLLAISEVESRFDGRSTSRVVNGKRVTGIWASTRRVGSGTWFCGVNQTIAQTWAECLAARDPFVGYRLGVDEMTYWLRRTRGNVTLALRGHGCGNAGLTTPCRGYAERVLRRVPKYRVATGRTVPSS